MPMTMAGKVYKLWVYGDVLCKMTPYLQGVSVTTSTFTITAMSLDRCLAILYPVKFRNLRTKRNVRTLIVLVWLTSFLLMIPLLFVNKTKTQTVFNNFKIVICSEEWTSVYQRRAYDFSLLFIVCLIPAQIVFVSYILMGKRLWVTDSALKANTSSKAVGSTRGSSHGPYDSVRASRRRTAKMCIVVSVVFVVCWLPYYTVNIYLDFKRDEGLLDIVYWGLFIGHLHCITNPILYCFMHKTFRYCVKRMLPCWRKSFVRTPSGYGTNAGNRMGSLVTSTRRACPAGERTHARLSQSCSASSSTSTATQPETSPVHGQDIKPPPRRVRLILMKLKRRRLCKESSNDSFKLVDIPSSITEEAPIETVT
ncbi:QRFPR-like protein [Mya arenaria]|uniref:QRFPR-like protein n=2 Tax=Mya arenaria TaxID=6604 RepID=A0ABY7FL14_MYAAR|nr:QRFPR-like protein [Mya arenaria]